MTQTTPPVMIGTDRLLLRRPTLADASAMFAGWARDIEAVRYLGGPRHATVAESEAHIVRCEAAWVGGAAFVHFLVDRATGDVIGSLASRPDDHGVNFGYVLRREAWGHGYMVEALDAIAGWWLAEGAVFRAWATCHVDNVQSARVLEKAGFTLEGTLRRWGRNPNVSAEPCDHRCYSRVRASAFEGA